MNNEGPFNINETVEYMPVVGVRKVGKVLGMENGKYKVRFEDGSLILLAEGNLKRTQILLG